MALAWALAALVQPAQAQTGIRITSAPAPRFTFGQSLTFQVAASSAADIVEARVFYRAGPEGGTAAGEASFTSGREVTALYSLDLSAQPLPAFAVVTFWWELRADNGDWAETPEQTFVYEDNRFQWQTRRRQGLTARWYEGEAAFGQTALDVLARALGQARADLPAELPEDVRLYVYAHAQDAALALQSTGVAWAAGHADPALGVLVAVIPPGLSATAEMEKVIAHEAAHLLVFHLAGGSVGYGRQPAWLNEGLAAVYQLQPDAEADAMARSAALTGEVLPLASLCAPFPAASARAQLAYAQSASMVRYLRDQYGAAKLVELVRAYAGGATCEAGVSQALSRSLDELERAWLEDLTGQAPSRTVDLAHLAPWLILAGLVLAGPLAAWALTRGRRVV